MKKLAVLALTLLCVMLLRITLQKKALQHQFDEEAAFAQSLLRSGDSPPPGLLLPTLVGKNVQVDVQHSADRAAILLFDVDSKICDSNWAIWDELLVDDDLGREVLPISISSNVPQEYLRQHRLEHRTIIFGLDKGLQTSLGMLVTPQTIFVKNGRVERVWAGILTDKDLAEIRRALDHKGR